jgi:uncharacterized protein YjiK
VSKELSKRFGFLLILAIALSAASGLSVQRVEALLGRSITRAAPRPSAPLVTSVDLSTYVRVGRFELPEPTRTAPPPNNLLAQEASAVTYNWDTDTLFITGDGGTSVTQVTKTGQLIDTMTLAPGSSPQGTAFFDPEGITYVGGGKFVLVEERDRQANLFTYVPGGILTRADVQTVKLGTTIGNVGLEGLSFDPLTNGFIFVKEADPISIFQTGIDFAAGTATNGSPTATGSTNLFNPALANLADFSDVFALSNLPSLNGLPEFSHLLILSQESGQIINVDRSGTVFSKLTIVADPDNPLPVAEQTHEGMTMDRDGNLYIVSENGGGDINHPQLWVYAPSTAPNLAPTAITLTGVVTSIPANTSTAAPVKLANIIVTDDGLGNNNLTVTGTDASAFQIIGTALYLKAGVALNSTVKPSYNVAVNVDDPGVGSAPDATTNYMLTVTGSTGGTASLIISEVAPWSSGNSDPSLRVDWFEVTNIGTAPANIVGWRVDDDSRNFNNALALNGVTSIAPGESVIFMETNDLAGKSAAFKTLWFGLNAPTNLQIGSYSGSGIGLSTGGDQVNLFDSAGTMQASVAFGASPTGPFPTFDNAAGLNNATISLLSVVGVNGAFAAANDPAEIGSPGTIGGSSTPIVNIVATDANAAEPGNDPGTFRISRTGSTIGPIIVSFTIATGPGQATSDDYTPTLTSAATIPAGQAFLDITVTPVNDGLVEGDETVMLTLGDTGSYDVGANGTATVTIIDALAQTINFDQLPNRTFGDAPFAVLATASSGLPVSFTASGNCTVNGVVTLTGAGDCTITASQAGDDNFNPAPDVSRTFSIAKAATTTTITADTPDPSVVDQQVTVNYQVSATALGIGPPTGNVTVTDGVDTCTGTVAAGSCVLKLSTAGARTLRATYAGDANFNGSSSPDEPHQVRIEIDQVYPSSAYPGERITITVTGKGFVPQSKISIEGLRLTIFTRYVSSTKLTATVIVSDNAFSSVRDVTVTNPDGSSSTKVNAFTVR